MKDNKLENWIPKAEVMERLGMSERTIDRLVEKGTLKQAYKPTPGRRPLPVYDPTSVKTLELEMAKAKPPGQRAARNKSSLTKEANTGGIQLAELVTAISDITPRVPITDKLFLTLKEASELSGLPRAYIKRQIKDGSLPAILAAGYRIRRADLEKL